MLSSQNFGSDITGVAFHPTKNILASSSKDTSIRLWKMNTSRVLSALTGHSKDNEECTCKHGLYERDYYEANPDCPVTGHRGPVYGVSFDPQGKILASCSKDKTVRLWDASTGAPVGSPLTGHERTVSCLAFKPGDPNILATGSADKTVKLWDTSTSACLSTMTGHQKPVCGVSFDPQGKTLASCSFDKTVRLWDASTGAPVGTPLTVEGCVFSVVFAPCGTKLAASCSDYPNHHSVKIFNKEGSTGNFLCQSTLEVDGEVACVTYAPDGSKLAAAYSRSIAIFNAETNEVPCTVSGHSKRVNVVRWNNDGTKFASGSNDNTVKIWNPATGEQPCQLKVDGAVICLAFSPTEDLIAACDHLGNILFLNTTGEKTLSPVTPVTSVHGRVSSIDFAPCGTKLACVLTLYSGSLCRHSVKIFTKERSTGNFVCQSTVDVDGAVSRSCAVNVLVIEKTKGRKEMENPGTLPAAACPTDTLSFLAQRHRHGSQVCEPAHNRQQQCRWQNQGVGPADGAGDGRGSASRIILKGMQCAGAEGQRLRRCSQGQHTVYFQDYWCFCWFRGRRDRQSTQRRRRG